MRRAITLCTVCIGIGLGLAALSAHAGDERRTADPDHPGYVYYERYCAACHGVFADGQGPVAPVLNQPSPDLTRLAQKYGSPLPQEKIREFVDGRDMARAHGRTDMPVWGAELRREAVPSKTDRPRIMLNVIVDYLASIQRPVDEPEP